MGDARAIELFLQQKETRATESAHSRITAAEIRRLESADRRTTGDGLRGAGSADRFPTSAEDRKTESADRRTNEAAIRLSGSAESPATGTGLAEERTAKGRGRGDTMADSAYKSKLPAGNRTAEQGTDRRTVVLSKEPGSAVGAECDDDDVAIIGSSTSSVSDIERSDTRKRTATWLHEATRKKTK